MKDYNIAGVIGRLTNDIEIKVTNSGKKVTSFTVASNGYGEDSYFIDCVAWEKSAEILEKYAKKGQRILVSGSLQTRTYDRKDGTKAKLTEIQCREIQLLENKKKESGEYEGARFSEMECDKGSYIDISPDDLPF